MLARATWRNGTTACTVVLAALLGLAKPMDAFAVPIDQIRLSRIASVTTIEIELGCAMRYLNHTPANGGNGLRVRLALGYDCLNALRSRPNSTHRPPGGRMVYLSSVQFDSITPDQAIISLQFEKPVSFKVRQTMNEYLLIIEVDTEQPVVAATPPPPDTVAVTAPPVDRRPRNQGPSRAVQRSVPQERDRFVLRLAEPASADNAAQKSLPRFDSKILYVSKTTLDGREWNELRLGFFDSESAALLALNDVRATFPDAWVSIATPDEQATAKTRRLLEIEKESREPAAPLPAPAPPRPLDPLSNDRAAALLAEAKDAMLRGDFDRGIKIYSRLLQQPEGSYRRTAREFLGVAHQKNGQLMLARAAFEQYVSEFPDGTDTRRVKQRLATLAAVATRPPPENVRQQPPPQTSAWNFDGAVSQFYLRGVNLTRDDEADVLSQSELLSQASFSARRRGERFDLLLRGNVGYLHDLVDDESGGQARSSYLYFDIKDNVLDLTARLGRQTLHRAGVLGRFDGVHIGYGLWRNLSVNVTAGFPIDSPRYLASTNRYFYGASARLSNVADVLDVSIFTNLQTVDGIADRRAVGADAQYHSRRLNVFGLLDYDVSYNVINNALLVGTWRAGERLSLNGRYQGGAGPFLTTRNAIIGQPVNTVEALMETYSEAQIRRLARNRTAQVRFGSAGLSAQLSQRWQMNADISYSEYGSTIASGGVAAFPATGPQYFYSGELLASSLLKAGDTVVFGWRHRQARDSNANTAILDLRLPIGDGLRINPRLAVTLRNNRRNAAGATQQWIANPMFRLYYSWRRTYRIEFEVGGYWSDQELPTVLPSAPSASIESSAYYLQLGYWLDFR